MCVLKAAWADRRRAIFLTDPKTGAIWYIGGTSTSGIMTNEIDQFQNEAWNTNLATIDGDNNSIDNGNSNASGAPTATVMNRFSGNTAHYHEGRIYIFGGLTMDPASSARSYQSFQNLPWINVTTSTPVIGTQLTLKGGPPQRQYHCSVITSSKKVIIYGGHDSNMNKTFNDIWSLDLITLTWSQIAVKNESRPRYGHNCNLVGANMIVYGGRATKENGTEYGYQDVQVFDIVQADWMQVYNPKLDPTPVSKPVPGGVGDPGNHGGGSDQLGHEGTGRKLSLGAIVGIAVAVVVILGSILVGIWIYRRRQRQIIAREKEMIQMGDSETGNAHGAIGRGSSGGRRSGSHKGQHQRRSRSHRQLPGHPNNPYRVSASSPLSYSGSTRLNSGNPGDRGSGTLGASGFDSASNTPGPNYMTIGGEEVLDGDQYPYPHRASAALS
ncbi:F-box only protein 42, partial [Lunasporangiospora selenospora]